MPGSIGIHSLSSSGYHGGLQKHSEAFFQQQQSLKTSLNNCQDGQAMKQDTGLHLLDMRVDGGMTVNNLLMQMQVPGVCSFFHLIVLELLCHHQSPVIRNVLSTK